MMTIQTKFLVHSKRKINLLSLLLFLCFYANPETVRAQCAPGATPAVSAFAIQPSCDSDGNVATDGYLQISATDGLSYEVLDGGNSIIVARTTLIGATFPLRVLTGLANPATDENYTIRVYDEDAGGASDCFEEEVVTLRVQDCAVGCDCKEYVYLNEPFEVVNGVAVSSVHKYLVGADGTLTELTTDAGDPWINQSPELSSAHGLGTDLNGFLYISEDFQSSDIRRLTCDGTIVDASEFSIPHGGSSNMIATGNSLVIQETNSDGISVIDVCNPTQKSIICFDGPQLLAANNSPGDWGLTKDENDNFYVATGEDNGAVYRFTLADADGPCVTPLFQGSPGNDIFPEDDGTPGGTFDVLGITIDGNGDIYVNSGGSYGANGSIYKFAPTGALLDQVATTNNPVGLIWVETCDCIYVSGNAVDCIVSYDTDLNLIPGAGITVANSSLDFGKAIAVNTECCPTNNNQSFEVSFCNSESSDPIFLNELFPCDDGTICEAQWTPVDVASMAVFEPCNQTIMLGVNTGCFSFTRSSDGTGIFNQCGAFVQTLNIFVGETEPPVIGGDQQICRGADPDAFTVISPASGTPAPLNFQWFVSSESDSTGFSPIAGATTEVYDPTAADIVADTMYFRSEVSVTGCTGAICADTSNAILVITVVDVAADAGGDQTICQTETSVDLTGATFTPTDFMATDGTTFGATWTSSSSGGTFFNAADTPLTAPVRFGEAATYRPSSTDIAFGSVVLTLTTDDLSASPFNVVGCEPEVDEVTITILKVDCGTYPWGGN
jgi:hypothetical protein